MSTVQELVQLRHDLPDLPPSPAVRRAELQRRQAELRDQLLQRAGVSFTSFVICTAIWAASGTSGSFRAAWTAIVPIVFLARNIWRLYGPAPELERVQRELDHRRRDRHRPTQLP